MQKIVADQHEYFSVKDRARLSAACGMHLIPVGTTFIRVQRTSFRDCIVGASTHGEDTSGLAKQDLSRGLAPRKGGVSAEVWNGH